MCPSRQLIGCILLFVSMLACEAKAQNNQETVNLVWNKKEQVLPQRDMPSTISSFSGATIDLANRLPYYRLQFPNAVISDFRLAATVYEPFSADEQKQFLMAEFGTEPRVHINNAKQNKIPVSIVSILPIRLNPQTRQLEKLTQFSYSITAGTNTTNSSANASSNFTSNSVLSTGNWFKLGVTTSGIHKIDKGILQSLGINTQNLDPKTIQVYGNGGGMLPQANSASRPDDLQENAVWVAGEADGRFDDNDYLIFYAQGPHTWQHDAQQNLFKHTYNIYSDTAFYFIRVGSATGLRVSYREQATGSTQTISSFDERVFHERDLRNMVMSGREWYGEDFSSFTLTRDIPLTAPDIVPGSDIRLTSFLMGNSSTSSSFTVKLNNYILGTQTISGRGTSDYHPMGINDVRLYTVNQQTLGATGTELKANLSYNLNGNTTATGYLNYLELNYQRLLKFSGDQISFRSVASLSSPVSTYQISSAPSDAVLWDVTDPIRPVVQQAENSGLLRFSTPSTTLREFVVFKSSTGLRPLPLGKVTNQNLHAINQNGNLDFVIITHPRFFQEATRLAEHRRKHSGLNTLVVNINQVYNEFSSGAQDVTAIRDFMRMLYKRSSKQGDDVIYLLLFGDTSYDYKNRLIGNTNYIPVYESRQSLHPITSYSSEDYYGFLDNEEGDWTEDNLGDHLLDIGIGRLPAKTPAEANTLVNKIIAYDSPSHFGKWRNKITLVADDGDGYEHQEDAEILANFLEENAPVYNPNKIYLDLYRQEVTANGQRAPAANNAINNAVEQGSLLVNYTGHGNEISWTAEQILTLSQIKNWKNKDNYTFMLTATCEFGRYDDPVRNSAAEVAMLHDQGGAVGLVTTTRPVFSNGNRVLNINFFKSAFAPSNNHQKRLGDVIRETKNNSISDNVSGSRGVNNRNFTLLSDPSMQLATPSLDATITHINNAPARADTLSALGKYTLRGQVRSSEGTVASNFSGEVILTVYEKQTPNVTFADENTAPATVNMRENILYDGKATVTNGLFESTFVVPKDIVYKYGPGKISLYARSSTQDALGASTNIIIGGTSTEHTIDNTPPVVNIYMEDESFIQGGITGTSPKLLVKLHDENGINTAGIGIGHEIIAVIDEKQESLIVLNDYYTAETDDYQKGRIQYSFKDLAPGPHSVRVKAWDTHNNATEEYIEFYVSNEGKISLEQVLNYPNPFSNKTTFHFDHNRAGEDLDIQIQIFTVSGKLIKTLETYSLSAPSHIASLSWNGRDEYNELLARGVYIYKVNIRSRQDGAKASTFEKLVILN